MKEGLNRKQLKFLEAFKSGCFTYLMAAGSVGSGKSFLTLGILHLLCSNISGLRFAVFRKSEKNLKQTTIPSYEQMKRASKSSGDSTIVDMTARYHKTGSEILFIWADITKDPELNNIRGLELTGCLFEEANQIAEGYFHIAKTRIGRWGTDKVKPFIMMNLNPSIGWCKDLFYDKWVDGKLPPRCYFEEFSVEDNELLTDSFIEGLEDLPTEEYNRFVKNKWEYSEIPNQLIKYEWYKQCILPEPEIVATDRAILAIDPAYEGDDDTGFGRMHGNHIGWWETYPKQDPTTSGILGIEKAKEFRIDETDVVVDSVGVGAGTVSLMHLKNFICDSWKGGDAASDIEGLLSVANKRAESHWILRELMRTEAITFTHHPQFQKECTTVTYGLDDKKIFIPPKKVLKKLLRVSPTYLDLATMLGHKYLTENNDLDDLLRKEQLKGYNVNNHIQSRASRERAKIIKQNRMG